MDIAYCRRESGADSKICMNKITRANALNWCDSCRERLPLWPAVVDAYNTHLAPAVAEAIAQRSTIDPQPELFTEAAS